MTRGPVVLAALLSASMMAQPGMAQQVDPSLGLQATRPALEELLQRLEETAKLPGSSEARAEAAAVRTRLVEGDFQAGDRILLRVEGPPPPEDGPRSVEQQLSDTFTVSADRSIWLPVIGLVGLRGVLRSELEPHLRNEVARFIREPVVRARSLIRVSVVGAVSRPGFYFMPTDALLSDALTAAGGLAADAKLPKLRIERAGRAVWEGAELQTALAQGRTLDDMHLSAGDQFVVPRRGRTTTYEVARTVMAVLSIPVTIYTLTKIFER